MKFAIRLFAAFGLIALFVTPLGAQTRVDTLPQIASFEKARFEFALTVAGEIFAYGQGQIDGVNRLHLALKTVPFEGVPEETVEAILYDGVYYVRENNDTQWYIEGEVAVPVPEDSLPTEDVLGDGILSLLGAVDVAGVPTDHYQVWFNFDDGSATTVDFFVGQRTPWLYKFQINGYLSGSDEIAFLGLDYRYYDFEDESIVVYAPQGAIARPSGAEASSLSRYLKVSMFQLRDSVRWQVK